MGQKEKLIAKLKTAPRNFTFNDAETLLGCWAEIKRVQGELKAKT